LHIDTLMMNTTKTLYKYFSLEGEYTAYSEQMLSRHEVFFSKPGEFNDPFDCRGLWSNKGTRKEKLSFYRRMAKEMYPNLGEPAFEEKVKALIRDQEKQNRSKYFPTYVAKDYLVYCMSEKRDDLLMWSHYANKHRGFVVGFRCTPESLLFSAAKEVDYTNTYPKVSYRHSAEQSMKICLYTKSIKWRYEKEYRTILNASPNRIRSYEHTCLTEIIFGCDMKTADKETIRKFVSAGQSNPQYFECFLDDNQYKLNILKTG